MPSAADFEHKRPGISALCGQEQMQRIALSPRMRTVYVAHRRRTRFTASRHKGGQPQRLSEVGRRVPSRAGRLGGADRAACLPTPVRTLAALFSIPHARY